MNLNLDHTEKAIEYLKSKYNESDIGELVDAEITSGNWVSEDDLNEDFPTEFDYYEEYCNGEAESAVRRSLEIEVLEYLGISSDQFTFETQKDIDQIVTELFTQLDT